MLRDVSFSLAEGRTLLVAGRNGSGKTTLFRILSTVLRPDAGSAHVAGHALDLETRAIRQRVALLSHPSYMYDALSALQNLQVVARFIGRPPARAALLPLLERVGLAERANDAVGTFSAGMRKRLALARVLLQEPSVVFLDEPYGQLDPPGFGLIDALVADFRNRGVTVLMATHQLERGAAQCDEGLVLAQGEVVWRGAAGDLPQEGFRYTSGTAEGAH